LLLRERDHKKEVEALKQARKSRADERAARKAVLLANIKEFSLKRWSEITSAEAPRTAFLRTGVIKRIASAPSFGKLTAEQTRTIVAELKKIYGGRKYIRIVEEVKVAELLKDERVLSKLSIQPTTEESFTVSAPATQIAPVRSKKKR
jgi:hypothetical protein